jgi:hypothetical protein
MREAGTMILAVVFVVSVIYLIVENLIVRAPLPMSIQRAFISIGITGTILGFTLFFAGA